jgi:phasin protein
MSTPHHTKSGGKSGPRARKSDPPRSEKPDQARELKPTQATDLKLTEAPELKPAQQPDVKAPIEAAVAAPTVLAIRAVASANPTLIDFQTIAMAYGNYTRKSFEQTKSFVERLASVRSLDKAIEIQTEFAKQAYETFLTESQKIRELYSGLARQSFEVLLLR